MKINPSALYQVEIEDGVKTRRRYIPTPVGVVGVSNYDESDNTTTRRYFLKDHLGSSSVVADDSGTVQSNYSYDAWGNPRNASNWSALSAWPDYEADEGFTGHEMMSSLELVHMNGRVYDPLIGRFLSPDIFIQAEGNLQNYNRYSYVLNNPLKYVDPSGNEFFTFFATIIAIGEGLGGYELFLLFFTAGFLDAYVESGDVGVSLKAGLISGTSAYFAHEIGTWFKDGWAANAFNSPTLANVVKATFHGVRGGIAAELSGGKFGAGAGAAFFGDYGGGLASEYIGEGLIVSAILGGTASEIGGGKFSNGALSGAMTFLLNTASHRDSSQNEEEDLNYTIAQNNTETTSQSGWGVLGRFVVQGGKWLGRHAKRAWSRLKVWRQTKLREQYVKKVRGLTDKVPEMRKAGMSSEQIARALQAERRALGVKYKNMTDPLRRKQIYERNLRRYEDKFGPTIKWLRKQGKSWEEIIESASRPGGADLGF